MQNLKYLYFVKFTIWPTKRERLSLQSGYSRVTYTTKGGGLHGPPLPMAEQRDKMGTSVISYISEFNMSSDRGSQSKTTPITMRWRILSAHPQLAHGPGSLELLSTKAPPTTAETATKEQGYSALLYTLQSGITVALAFLIFLNRTYRIRLFNVTMLIISSRNALLSVYYPQIFLILTSGSYL